MLKRELGWSKRRKKKKREPLSLDPGTEEKVHIYALSVMIIPQHTSCANYSFMCKIAFVMLGG